MAYLDKDTRTRLTKTVQFDTVVVNGKVTHTPRTIYRPADDYGRSASTNGGQATGTSSTVKPTTPLGSWGTELTFEVKEGKIMTFSGLKRSMSSRWATHSRMRQKDQSEFLGPGLQTLSFTMILSAMYGVSPRSMIDVIEKAIEAGTVNPFVVGGKRIGNAEWKITSASDAWDVVWAQGELIKATLDITMEEYY